eukprot:scaffold58908_cov56-Phaeocystis_antarctica.AAC.1
MALFNTPPGNGQVFIQAPLRARGSSLLVYRVAVPTPHALITRVQRGRAPHRAVPYFIAERCRVPSMAWRST